MMENKCILKNNLTELYSYKLDGSPCIISLDDFISFIDNEFNIQKNKNYEYYYWVSLIGFGFLIGVLLSILILKVILEIYLKKITLSLKTKQNIVTNNNLNDVEILIDTYINGWKRKNGELDKYQDLLRPKLIP